MDGPRDYHIKYTRQRKTNIFAYMWNLKKDTNEFIYKTEIVTDIENKQKRIRGEKGIRWREIRSLG